MIFNVFYFIRFFFFKQKTSYEVRISDWSADVCSSDLFSDGGVSFDAQTAIERGERMVAEGADLIDVGGESTRPGARAVAVEEELARIIQIGRASCRERVCQYV